MSRRGAHIAADPQTEEDSDEDGAEDNGGALLDGTVRRPVLERLPRPLPEPASALTNIQMRSGLQRQSQRGLRGGRLRCKGTADRCLPPRRAGARA